MEIKRLFLYKRIYRHTERSEVSIFYFPNALSSTSLNDKKKYS